MVSLEELIPILENGTLTFKLAIIIGIVIIIIAIVPSLSVPILKIAALNLSKNQSMVLGAVGGVLILGGLVGLSQMVNDPPIIEGLTTNPTEEEDIIAYPSGTIITVNVKAKDPDSDNFLQNTFSSVTPLQYDFSYKGPGTGDIIVHGCGPCTNNTWTWEVFPGYAGKNMIMVNVTDRPAGGEDTKYTLYEHEIKIEGPNQPPKIEKVYADCNSSHRSHPNDKIKIIAEARDRDQNDKLSYRFLRQPPNNTDWLVIRNWSEENDTFWRPNENDIGDNYIRAQVRDYCHSQFQDDYKDLKIEIIDRQPFNLTSNSSEGST